MNLLLTSSGLLGTSLENDFLEMIPNKDHLRVAIIPTASDPIEWIPENKGDQIKENVARMLPGENEQHKKWLRSYQHEWEKRGYSVIIADLKEDPNSLKTKLENVDIIDVLGGDINWLLDWAKKSKLDTYLGDLIINGVVYVGTSAGSGLVTPDIGLTWWDPEWKLDHIGLGIVDFIVVAHQKESDDRSNIDNLMKRREYLQTIIHFPWKIYLLQDGQAIKVTDNNIEHIGPGVKKFI